MKTSPISKGWNWLIVCALLILVTCTTQAQVNFVQITDPHIFDDIKDDGSRLDDKAAFASFVEKLNQRVVEKAAEDGSTYDFVVVTGDLGLEQLVKGGDEVSRANSLKAGAAELASLIGLSKISTWLFVPGNNDLLDEKPTNIRYYYDFIQDLQEALKGAENQIKIIDLCAEDGTNTNGHAKNFFQIRNYAFIGFNDASFKNTDVNPDGSPRVVGPPLRINENFVGQLNNVSDVRRQLDDKDIDHVYIFYHIPEIDDPYFVTLNEQQVPLKTRYANEGLIGKPYLYSSWFVKTDVRKEWDRVVRNDKVQGLFAGHFHDYKKSTYQNFQWLRERFHLSDTLAKLHVCPPLALKKQKGQEGQARGFQEVYLDADGKVSARIFWFEAGWNLSAELAGVEAASLKELELGRTYEELNQFKEAEAAYSKAAESNWVPTRQAALTSLRRVVQNQDSWLTRNVSSPIGVAWGAGLTAVGTALITALLTAIVLVIIWYGSIPVRRHWKKKGRNKLKIGPFIDSPKGVNGHRFEQVVLLIHGRLRTHFKPRKLVKGVPRLPMIATSQSAEVVELAESLAPGALGKYFAWLLKKKDQSQYSIEGVVQSRRFWERHPLIFVSLRDNYEDGLNWHRTRFLENYVADEKDLAFEALKRLVRYMHK